MATKLFWINKQSHRCPKVSMLMTIMSSWSSKFRRKMQGVLVCVFSKVWPGVTVRVFHWFYWRPPSRLSYRWRCQLSQAWLLITCNVERRNSKLASPSLLSFSLWSLYKIWPKLIYSFTLLFWVTTRAIVSVCASTTRLQDSRPSAPRNTLYQNWSTTVR